MGFAGLVIGIVFWLAIGMYAESGWVKLGCGLAVVMLGAFYLHSIFKERKYP